MVTRDAFLAAIIATATFVNGLLLAQQPTRRPDGERPEPNAEPAEFLRWLDRNRNGTIDRNELVGQFGARIQALARTNQNIDLTRPVPIDKLVREFSHNQSRSGTTSPRFPSAEPLVPGFGVENDLPRVPGFGVEDDLPRVPGFGTAGDFFSVRVIDQDRRTVDERFRRYDSNRDGYLSREELARNRWSDDPLVYDRNRDGHGEFTEQAADQAAHEQQSDRPGAGTSSPPARRGESTNEVLCSTRHERE
ncbi:MAG: hypothetical protein IH987_05420 [Planctomycetes bacterium]|nr:hypothetical protein [Planctomycetota bacterium]